MKKFTSTALGGAPVFDDDLLDIFNSEIWVAIQALLSPFDSDTQGIVVSGCVTTNNAGNFDMTAGVVYLNGEFMRISAVTNQAFTKYIAPSTPVNDDRSFADTTTHTVAVTKGAGLVSSAPGAGQYITIASLADPDKRRLRGQWKSLPIINGWAIANTSNPRYRISAGKVEFRGQLDGTGASSSLITASGVFPSAGYNIAMASNRLHVSTLATDACSVSSDTSGRLSSANDGFSSVLYLDGLQYFF